MKKHFISNPFTGSPTYNCFGCSPSNSIGLKLRFREEGEWLMADWDPCGEYEGWLNTLHGGIQATLLDEIGSWIVFVKLGTAGVTSKLEMKFRKAVLISDGTITLKAKIVGMKRNIAMIEASLHNSQGLCADALMHYFTFPAEKARKEFLFPEREAFFSEE